MARTPRSGRRAMGVAAGLVLLAGLTVTGCGTGEPATGGQGSSGGPAGQAAKAKPKDLSLGPSNPVKISIGKIGVNAPVGQLDLLDNGRIQEPPLSRPNLTGWYKNGAAPGEIGPAVILGHVDSKRGPAVFYKARTLKKGDTIEVTRKDGKVAVFTVERLKQVPKAKFPGQEIYAAQLDHAALRLVTCGGSFDKRTGHYVNNVIVYARMTGIR
jgi:hypothetical protein